MENLILDERLNRQIY